MFHVAARYAVGVYVSTVNAFGNMHGQVVDETYQRSPGDWLSMYDRTK